MKWESHIRPILGYLSICLKAYFRASVFITKLFCEKLISTFKIVKFYIYTSPIILQIYNFFLTKFYILQLFSLKILHLQAP